MENNYNPQTLYLCQVIKARNIVKYGNMTKWKPEIVKYVVCQWPNECKNNDIFVAPTTGEQFYASSFCVGDGCDTFVRVVNNLGQMFSDDLCLDEIKDIERKKNKELNNSLDDGAGIAL